MSSCYFSVIRNSTEEYVLFSQSKYFKTHLDNTSHMMIFSGVHNATSFKTDLLASAKLIISAI